MLDAPDEPAVAGQEQRRMGALPAELVDHVGRRAPVGVDQAALDPHRRRRRPAATPGPGSSPVSVSSPA